MEAVVLVTRQDVALARPGVRPYVVQSGSDAYFPAMALIEERTASLLGESFTAAGHVVTLRVLRASAIAEAMTEEARENPRANPPEPEKRTITIGGEFFITALKDYNDWPIKWWREAVQNSVDAGARNVTCGTRVNADLTVTVWCDDDGRGMDEDIILNKFLVLGATTKTSTTGAAGGFGKAKELLLLPWIKWKIHSRETLVEGAGIDYTASSIPSRPGTRLEVVMPADRCTTSPIALAFLEKCNLPHVRFTVEGDDPTIYPKTASAALVGGNVIETVENKAEVFFIPKKGDTQPYMYVRTKGLYMFKAYAAEVPGFLVVELTAPSIEVLTANRDGFRDWQLERAIQRLGERVAIDKMSALKSEKGLIRKKYEGTGKFEARARAAMAMEQIGPYNSGELTEQATNAIVDVIGAYEKDQERQPQTPSAMAPKTIAGIMLDQKFLGADHLEAALKQLVWQPDFYVMNDIEGFKVPKKFFPETMTPTVLKLAKVWVELCRYVLVQLGSDRKFGVGFIFSEHTLAAAQEEKSREGYNESWLMLNPFKDLSERKEIWRTSDADLKWLYAAAIHECTHIADGISYHDESFASALTMNMAKCADGYRKIRAIAAGIKMRGAPTLGVSEEAE